ncbi:MAG: helix-turn-helix transcriptional regulator, partial [Actinomycetota bacterium]
MWGTQGRITLVERDSAVTELRRVLKAAAQGEGSLTLVEGASGMGRSRTLDVAADLAADVGLLTLRASGGEVEQATPFSVVTDLLRSAIDPDDPEIFRGAAKLARPLFTSERADPRQVSRFHGLVWTISNLSYSHPLALVVDDVQWADPATLRFFNYLVRHLSELPVALIVALRPGEFGENFEHLVGLRSQPGIRSIVLEPMSARGCAEMLRILGHEVAADAGAVCFEITGGVPRAVATLAKSLADHEVVDGAVLREAVRAADGPLHSRLDLRTEDLEVCRAIAVLGPDATIDRVAALLERPGPVVESAIESLFLKRVLRRMPSLGFVVATDRADAYSEIPAPERSDMHLRVAELLLEQDERLPRVAAHLLLTEPGGGDWVADALEEASREALNEGAPELAVRYLSRALGEPLDDRSRARLLASLAPASVAAGDDRYREQLNEASALLDTEDAIAEVYHEVGRNLYGMGRLTEACDILDEALASISEDGPAGTKLRTLYMLTARLEPQRRAQVIREIRSELAGSIEDSLSGRLLLMEAALASIRACEPHEKAAGLALRAVPPPDESFDDVAITTLVPQLIPTLTWCDLLDEAHRVVDRALSDARASGSLLAYANAGTYGAMERYMQGYIREAEALGQQALDALPFVWSMAVPYAATITAYASMERDDLDAAEDALRRTEGPGWADTVERPFYLEARGRLRALKDDLFGAIEDLTESGQLMVELIGTNNPAMLGWRSRLARIRYASGRAEGALELVDEEIDHARAFGAPRPLATALRVSGELREAIEPVEEALALLEGSPARLERCYCLLAFGRLLLEREDQRGARDALTEALMIAETTGSVQAQIEARRALRFAGARPRRLAVTGVAALTPGELRVARFAARGYSNREIAEALFVTVKAVEWHLGNAYRKLG